MPQPLLKPTLLKPKQIPANEAMFHPDAANSRWVAQVDSNETRSLMFMPSLVQKKFGITFRKDQGRCLLAQIAYSIEAQLPFVKASRIVTHVDKWCKAFLRRPIDMNGHTMQEILASFNVPVNIGEGRSLHIDLRMKRHTLFDDAVHSVISGQPVMVIVDRDVCTALESEAVTYKDGEVRATVIRPSRSGRYHCLLAIGLDVSGYTILRDIREKYAFKGYLKVASHVLADGFTSLQMFSAEVHGFTLDKPYKFPTEACEKDPSLPKLEITFGM